MVWSRLARNIARRRPDRIDTISDREKCNVVDRAGSAIAAFASGAGCLYQGTVVIEGPGETPVQWQDELYDLLRRNGVTQFAYVPDAGHRILIDRSLADAGAQSV